MFQEKDLEEQEQLSAGQGAGSAAAAGVGGWVDLSPNPAVAMSRVPDNRGRSQVR